MAEAVGLVCNVLQLIQVTESVIAKLYRYYYDVCHSERDVIELRNQIGMQLYLLNELHEVLQSSASPHLDFQIHYAGLNERITSLGLILCELHENVNPERVRGRSRLIWPVEKRKVEGWLKKIRMYNEEFETIINARQLYYMHYNVD
jgi:hypothetical protein